jgi:DNA-binding GntR family transcriptional regulator
VHAALLTAVLEGRGDEAATIMLEHIRDFEEQVRRVL